MAGVKKSGGWVCSLEVKIIVFLWNTKVKDTLWSAIKRLNVDIDKVIGMTLLRFKILVGWGFLKRRHSSKKTELPPALSRLQQQLVECGSGRGSCWAGEGSVLGLCNLSRGKWSHPCPSGAFRQEGNVCICSCKVIFRKIVLKNSLSPLWLC